MIAHTDRAGAAEDAGDVGDAEVIRISLEEPGAFALLFDGYAPEIHRYAVRRLGPPWPTTWSPTRSWRRSGGVTATT
ncbi:DNA-directed RNA polymerase sigma-70 factor [Planomonospora sphaerica]|uniref:DNA-directed RNA polymerase sigma-70 factor n=1 Tax=Planomonospora sphaerica TaxID=161355 RepID=A0A161LXZ9_9ACTN|nr:hypothetical protein [Planomonospora sphaerica]GAT70569.1 DNA-directed RNA polymerase sigma-70 factor [Planomonospora sphaerica]